MRTIGIEAEHISNASHSVMATLLQSAGLVVDRYAIGHYTCREGCYSGWQVKTDGSINSIDDFPYGIELASPPFTLADSKQVLKAFKVANVHGAVNRSCGLHIHVGASELVGILGDMQFYRYLEGAWLNMQSLFYTYVPPSRRNNNYCRIGVYTGDKYRGLNLNHLANEERIHTIEFRMHNATLNARKILAFAALCEKVVDAFVARTPLEFISPTLNVEVPDQVVRKRHAYFRIHKTTGEKDKWIIEEKTIGKQAFPSLKVAYDELHEKLQISARDPLQAFNYPEHGNAMTELCKKLVVPKPYKGFLEARYEAMLLKHGPFVPGKQKMEVLDSDDEDFYNEQELDQTLSSSAF